MSKHRYYEPSADDRLDQYIKSINDKEGHRAKKEKSRRKDKDYMKKYGRDYDDKWN